MNVFLAKPFRLPDDFFPPIHMSEGHLMHLRAEADEAVRNALINREKYHKSRATYLRNRHAWRLHAEFDGLKAFTRQHKRMPRVRSTRIVGAVHGSFRDIASLFKTTTSADYLDVTKMLYKYTVDARVLHVIARTPTTLETIKWAAVDAFALRHRLDSCHFESVGAGIDSNGKPYVFRVIIPTIFPEVPDLYISTRTVRVYHKSVMLLTPSGRNWNSTEFFVSSQNDLHGINVPRRLYKKHLESLAKIMSFVDIRRIASAQRALSQQPERDDCSVCARAFSFLRSRHACSVCGESVCRKCFVKGSDVLQVKCPSKFCTACLQRLRQQPREPTPVLESSYDRFVASYIRVGAEPLPEWSSSPRVATRTSRSSSAAPSELSSPGVGSWHESESVELTVDTSAMRALQTIHSSLHVQEALLRELHAQRQGGISRSSSCCSSRESV